MDLWVHLVWRVHARSQRIEAAVQEWLWPALAAKARELGSARVVVGGVQDHVHVLAALPPNLAVAELARRLKGGSSRVAHLKGLNDFAWQEGYGAFTVSREDVASVGWYVVEQPRHHQAGTFDRNLEPPTALPEGHLEQ